MVKVMVFFTGMELKPNVWANTHLYAPVTVTSTPISLFMLPVLVSGTSHEVTETSEDSISLRFSVSDE